MGSLGLEGGKETRLVVKGDNNPKTSTGDSSGDNFKKQFPSFDVKIIGGKKLIIYHDDDLKTSISAKITQESLDQEHEKKFFKENKDLGNDNYKTDNLNYDK